MSASSPQPLEGMANPEPESLYTNGGMTGDGAGDMRMPEDVDGNGNGALVDDANHPGTHDAQSSGDMRPPTGDGRDGSPMKSHSYHESQPKPNKVYIGNLPEQTRESDLESCFGKIGRIASIELKFGYGFVEFETQEAAEESVAKYHEGWFMGNKIKVEISRGRNKGKGDQPGACFKCGQLGHWARECPHGGGTNGATPHYSAGHRPANNYRPDHPLVDRMSSGARDYAAGPPPPGRDYPPGNRDGYGPDRYASGGRYGHDYHGPARDPPPRDARDYYPPGAPPARLPPAPPRPARDFDDYSGGRRDYRAPPPGPPAPYEARPYYPEYERDPGYARPPYNGAPPARDGYDRSFDRRGPPPDRYGPPPSVQRPRTPPGPPPPRGRDGYPAARDYAPLPPAADYRRPVSPGPGTRHGFDFPPRPDNRGGFRHQRGRSQSPGPRGAAAAGYRNYGNDGPAPVGGFGPPADRGPYGGAYAGNGYTPGPPIGGMPPMAGHARPVGRGRPDDRDRDYAPRAADRGGDAAGYSRRP